MQLLMKVVAFEEFGAAGNLQLADRPMPTCGPDDVLIKTAAVSVNPVDVKTRQGEALASQLEHALPLVLGWDIAGKVVAVGRNDVVVLVHLCLHSAAHTAIRASGAREGHAALRACRNVRSSRMRPPSTRAG